MRKWIWAFFSPLFPSQFCGNLNKTHSFIQNTSIREKLLDLVCCCAHSPCSAISVNEPADRDIKQGRHTNLGSSELVCDSNGLDTNVITRVMCSVNTTVKVANGGHYWGQIASNVSVITQLAPCRWRPGAICTVASWRGGTIQRLQSDYCKFIFH